MTCRVSPTRCRAVLMLSVMSHVLMCMIVTVCCCLLLC